ncbi:sugar ABC transporter substrate-binding protein [Nocardia mexicana]|uniref:Ribose transport system substrate-binding protein n=1 Tax=Nocardia mexicana TaxID=279262 RepID=A0A370HFX6_9NOCA|nr:substrate-binding domain-containing protein [Nocardia mexicana]RDI55962.1 ribose transport system substrate-binding protein [Nocardia mexicana]
MSRKKILALVTAALAAFAVAGCSVDSGASGGGEASGDQAFGANVELMPAVQKAHDVMKDKKIAFVPILYKGYALTENWGSTMERAFGSLGADFEVYDANFSSDRMISIINDLIARKAVDVLVLQNQDLGLLDNAIQQAERAGIRTVVLNMMSTRLGDAFIGVDVHRAARTIAQRAADDCGRRNAPKQVSVIDGPGNDPASLQWNQGIREVLEPLGYTVTVSHSQFQNAVAQQAADSMLQQQQGKLCGFLVTYDVNAVTVGQTVASAVARGQVAPDSVGVYTFDANSGTCEAMKQGLVTASVAYDVQGIGEAAVAATQQLIQTGAQPGSSHTVAFVADALVDKTNVDDISIACYKGR